MENISCIIVDDEQLSRLLIEGYLEKIPSIDLKGTFKDAQEALLYLQEDKVDLIFLDIQMPTLTGIEFIKSLNYRPQVVFITAYPQYAIEGYELNIVDYLLKPVSFERFLKAAVKAQEQILLVRKAASPETSTISSSSASAKHLLVKSEHRLYRIAFEDILYIEGSREYLIIHTAQENISTLMSFKNLLESLPEKQFIRVHKSFVVNRDKVKSLYGNQLEIDNARIPIGKMYKNEVLENLF
ncbi:LytTR family DNA-binding domain-containing protein [Halosquirtibacter xylanolyticus]|uniref:LytR/AlgR family response regulator transcription factor n=1 Tax=Halosquirtibacter xylanolyticus TaxID=3374599 RepID=UPI0037493630|nr:LytTR family DNA-binding domain-containing protein [Prolixibacteraceae bacterium]